MDFNVAARRQAGPHTRKYIPITTHAHAHTYTHLHFRPSFEPVRDGAWPGHVTALHAMCALVRSTRERVWSEHAWPTFSASARANSRCSVQSIWSMLAASFPRQQRSTVRSHTRRSRGGPPPHPTTPHRETPEYTLSTAHPPGRTHQQIEEEHLSARGRLQQGRLRRAAAGGERHPLEPSPTAAARSRASRARCTVPGSWGSMGTCADEHGQSIAAAADALGGPLLVCRPMMRIYGGVWRREFKGQRQSRISGVSCLQLCRDNYHM